MRGSDLVDMLGLSTFPSFGFHNSSLLFFCLFISFLNIVSCFPFVSLCHQLYIPPDLYKCLYKWLAVTLAATVPETNVLFLTKFSFSSCSHCYYQHQHLFNESTVLDVILDLTLPARL